MHTQRPSAFDAATSMNNTKRDVSHEAGMRIANASIQKELTRAYIKKYTNKNQRMSLLSSVLFESRENFLVRSASSTLIDSHTPQLKPVALRPQTTTLTEGRHLTLDSQVPYSQPSIISLTSPTWSFAQEQHQRLSANGDGIEMKWRL